MHQLHLRELALEGLAQRLREHGAPIVLALPITDRHLPIGTVEILHTQAYTFHETQASPLEQTGHEGRCAVEWFDLQGVMLSPHYSQYP